MDLFSLGSVIAGLFLDRESVSLFTLSELLSFRDLKARENGTAYDPLVKLNRIPQRSVRKLICLSSPMMDELSI